jgi:hypothetical protein
MSYAHETYEFGCTRVVETDNAVLIIDPLTKLRHWIPLSQVDEMHFDKDGNGTIVMTAWIAKRKGIID